MDCDSGSFAGRMHQLRHETWLLKFTRPCDFESHLLNESEFQVNLELLKTYKLKACDKIYGRFHHRSVFNLEISRENSKLEELIDLANHCISFLSNFPRDSLYKRRLHSSHLQSL